MTYLRKIVLVLLILLGVFGIIKPEALIEIITAVLMSLIPLMIPQQLLNEPNTPLIEEKQTKFGKQINKSQSMEVEKNTTKLLTRIKIKVQKIMQSLADAVWLIIFHIWLKITKRGRGVPLLGMSQIYVQKEDTEDNRRKRAKCLQEAAEKEWKYLKKFERFAYHEFGTILSEGKGIEQNYEEAINWYKKAVELGFHVSKLALGVVYYHKKTCQRTKEIN